MASLGLVRDDAGTGLVVDLLELSSASLESVGGKALNLGRLAAADFPVPPGFCLTTAGYRKAAPAELDIITARLDAAERSDGGRGLTDERNGLARQAREAMTAAPVPPDVESAIREAYAALGSGPVAVRSSATAEDLPFASFAGQQDSFMDVVGADAVVEAVRRCWASLWTDRAVAYRTTNGISHRDVGLAVVIQKMVGAGTAGVLFTANPVTGTRTETVIDASPGPGQAVVSGSVNPDHFVVETASGRILQQPQGRAPSLTGPQLRELTALGDAAQRLFNTPQDVEWVIDGGGTAWLTQSRPITTLYPLPEEDPFHGPTGGDGMAPAAGAASGTDTRVYLCGTLLQGLTRPITPMGLHVLALMRGNNKGPWKTVNPGLRMYVDLTPILRNKSGREMMAKVLPLADGRSAAILPALLDDLRFSVARPARRKSGHKDSTASARTHTKGAEGTQGLGVFLGLIPGMVRALLWPDRELRRARRYQDRLAAGLALPLPATAARRLQHTEDILATSVNSLIQASLPAPAAGYLTLAAARRLLRGIAEPRELEAVLRGLPHNVTTIMDLELWHLAVSIGSDPEARRTFTELQPGELAARYKAGALPAAAQSGLHAFLSQYGHRAVAEIDLGMPRWFEEPDHILGMISNYLRVDDPAQAPDRRFARAAEHAEARISELVERAGTKSRLRGRLVAWCLRRTRQLAGLRELPKFCIVLVLAEMHRQLTEVGATLVKDGSITASHDVFFLDFDELRVGLRGADLKGIVAGRRRLYDVELRRRRIPRLLLSDGTDVEAAMMAVAAALPQPVAADRLTGTPASAGSATGKVRVVMDPVGAHLEPGEILVAPSTDPGWTPLFMTAGALVMEMGGVVSHGAVVAREYGIPAVVGVADATTRLHDGQSITVDGAAGTVTW
ncbi:pyruvate phosphate dikinase, PEP/pyruvate binding domain protein [Pseudarthrobacter siccitolerans]|uniref:Pyruvate phosphate dikinase, PEP/pyruvate binding domain protein n=1 Tax=Pseudarthrobacter siccitolerans TaxID=861266 RepID=A0A024H638_9MICC|nr:PEP/pyruvate-binding domain-containing protein [Pseudarthrobacter siccitolerans]CCQ47201.1 pyruvate phosphate dikinase, PEP/pyruvate binding domain protein [Pseudarthrobacter siccitolerans]